MEGPYSAYNTVIFDGEIYRLYDRGHQGGGAVRNLCYAESQDGRTWVKPKLDLHPWGDERVETNILLVNDEDEVVHNFMPFLDTNPAVQPEERFKAFGGGEAGLLLLVSADGVHWRKRYPESVYTRGGCLNRRTWRSGRKGEGYYVLYFWEWTEGKYEGFRTIARARSTDLVAGSEPVSMDFGSGDVEQFCANATEPYFRNLRLYVALPSRFVQKRQ